MFSAFSTHFQQTNFLIYLQYSLASKSVFVIKLACANLALKELAAKLLNHGIEIYICHDHNQ